MVGSATVTAAVGPGMATGTHIAISNISKIELDLKHEVFTIYHGDSKVSEFSLVGITGLATTITGVTGSSPVFEID